VRKLLLILIAAAAQSAPAQTPAAPKAYITPVGLWFLCDAPPTPNFFLCSAYMPTAQKTFLLSIQPSGRAVTNFHYTVSATVNGEPWTTSGTVDRADTIYTLVTLDAPGRLDLNPAPEITITERTDVLIRPAR
jgi:hypothetical protein